MSHGFARAGLATLCLSLSLTSAINGRGDAQSPVPEPIPLSAREPTFRYSVTRGCSSLFVFTTNADWSEILWVSVRLGEGIEPAAEILPLPPPGSRPPSLPWVEMTPAPIGIRTYDVAVPRDGLRAGVDFNDRLNRGGYCSDVRINSPLTWPAVAGRLVLTIRHVDTPPVQCGEPPCLVTGFPVELKIESMTFQAPDGRRVALPAPLTLIAAGGGPSGG